MFGKKKNASAASALQANDCRPDQVARLARLIVNEDNAILFDADGSGEYERASGLLDAARRNSTEAEFKAAFAMAKEYQEAESAEYHRTGDSSVLALCLDDIHISVPPTVPAERPASVSHHRTEPPSTTHAHSQKEKVMSLFEVVAQLNSISERMPMEQLNLAIDQATSDAAQQANQDLLNLAGETQQVLQGLGHSNDIAGAIDMARAKLEQAIGAYGILKMHLEDARAATEQARETLATAARYHSR